MKTLSSVLCECSVIHVEPGGLVLHKVEAMWIISLSLESDTLGHSELKLAQPLLLEEGVEGLVPFSCWCLMARRCLSTQPLECV